MQCVEERRKWARFHVRMAHFMSADGWSLGQDDLDVIDRLAAELPDNMTREELEDRYMLPFPDNELGLRALAIAQKLCLSE